MKISEGNRLAYLCALLMFVLLSGPCAHAQVESLMHAGDSLHRLYRFDDALELFDQALEVAHDREIQDTVLINTISAKLLLSENGSNMSRFVRKPVVVGRQMSSLEDFFLYYPLENKSWRKLPNQLDADVSHKLVRSLYAPDWNDVHYYSAEDENGVRSIFVTELQDTLWSVPEKVEEISSAVANEIYPMLSPDGKTLFFSSDGLYGLGGYDIYYSLWDDSVGCWSMPQNMGIPFSSPADDFLFVDSEDERYSLFASTRDCPKDSVWVYVIERERLPVHFPVDSPEELMTLSLLDFESKQKEVHKKNVQSDDLTSLYMSQMNHVRALKDSIATISEQMDELRTELTFSNDESERFELSSRIIEMEQSIPSLQRKLEESKSELQKTEYEFLKKGVFINAVEEDTEESEVEDFVDEYEFVRHSYGDSLQLSMTVPETKFDYTFRILDEAVFAEDQNLPEGVVYQIQLFGGARKAALHDLKGLSPVYEHRSPSGMYIYRVGCFTKYDEALENVQKVRSLGFKNAYLCAFENGNEVSVAQARTLQERLRGGFSLYEIRIIPESGELEQNVVDAIVSAAVGKDIIRSESADGTQVFTVGPFDSKEDADALVETVEGMMPGKVVCEPIN